MAGEDLRVCNAESLTVEGIRERRRQRPVPVDAQSETDPVEASVGERQGVGRKELRVQLRVPVLQGFLVLDGLSGLAGRGGRIKGLTEEGVARGGAPQPEVIPPDRTTDPDSVVPPGAAGVKGARRTEELVRAALRHEVESDSGRSQRRIGSSGRDLDAAEGVEIVVERRHASLADPDAVQVVAVLARPRALPDEGRLPRVSAASDVHVGSQNSGNLPQDGPGVPCRRNAFELLLTKGRARLNRPAVQRHVAGDRERFRHPGDGHDGREHRVAERHGDVPPHRSEPRPLEPHGVGSRRKIQKVEIPPRVGVRCLYGPRPGDGHCHARDGGTLTVHHRAVEVPRRRRALGPGIGWQKRRRQHKRREGLREFHLPSKVGNHSTPPPTARFAQRRPARRAAMVIPPRWPHMG